MLIFRVLDTVTNESRIIHELFRIECVILKQGAHENG